MALFDHLLPRRRRERDLENEIAAHLSLATSERVAAGADPREARLAALKEFGNVTRTRERTRLAWGHIWIDRAAQLAGDLRFALRRVLRSPGYSAVVVSVLALGVGTNLIAFGLFQALALTPLAGVRDSGRLQFVFARASGGRDVALTYPDYTFLRDHMTSYDSLAGSFLQGWMIGRGAEAKRVFGELVSANYFDVLGVRAQHGRVLEPADDRRGNQVAVMSDALWRREFAADPGLVGRTIELNRTQLTVVGIAAPDFRGAIAGIATELFVPYQARPEVMDDRQRQWVFAFGRPRPGVSLSEARAETTVLSARLAAAHPVDGYEQRAVVAPIWQSPQGAQTYMMPAVSLMGVTAGILLLVVCANVAGLVLVRNLSRRGELATRLAVGAGRGRVLRLLLGETLVLAIPGAALGFLLPPVVEPYLNAAQPSTVSLPLYFNAGGRPVVAMTVLLACVSAVLAGLVPALRASRIDLASAIKDDLSPLGSTRSRLRSALVVAQVALSTVLLVGTVLVTRSLEAARRADPGFDPTRVASVLIDLLPAGYDDAQGRVFYETLLRALRADPSIEAASLMKDPLLMHMPFNLQEFVPEGYQRRSDEDLRFLFNVVGTGHFRTLRIPVLAGREFDARDDRDGRVAMVNETLARRYFGGVDAAIGKRLRTPAWPNEAPEWRTIVGVARDIKYTSLAEAARPYVYLPHAQAFNHQMFVHARGAGSTTAVRDAVLRHLRALDPDLPILDTAPLSDQISIGVGIYDITARTLGIIGLAAIALTALGIYGVVAYTVKQGTHEIGIRMAVGAPRGHIIRRYVARGLRLATVGGIVGIAAAFAGAQAIGSLLYGVTATDPLSFVAAALAVLGVTLAASLVPAWGAARIDPMAALRHT